MSKNATGAYQVKFATDVCMDYSIGQNVFAYLEKTLTNEDDISTFVKHAGDCSFCMQTIIKWHYDSVVSEMNEKAAEINAISFSTASFNSIEPVARHSGEETDDDQVSEPVGVDRKAKLNTRSH